MNIKKSKRIDKIVSLVDDKVSNVYDIACDHGYIGISILLAGKTKNVVFSDIAESPLNSCKGNVRDKIFNDPKMQDVLDDIHVDYRLGDGLNIIKDGEIVDTVIIAGIGYDLMIKIIENIEKYNIKTLIASVQTKVSDFRKYLDMNKYNVVADEMVLDDKYYYIQKIRFN